MIWLLFILAHDPITTKITWTREISRIVAKRCSSCHGSGSSVPLSTYEEARPWAKAIRDQVLQRKMPPWGAVKGVGEFSNDPSLTALELEMITQWVEGGAPKGEPTENWSLTVSPQHPLMLDRAQVLIAIRPGAPMEVTAYLPNGSVEHLIWIRDPQPDYERAYIFRDPITLPAGTKIRAFGATTQSCAISAHPISTVQTLK